MSLYVSNKSLDKGKSLGYYVFKSNAYPLKQKKFRNNFEWLVKNIQPFAGMRPIPALLNTLKPKNFGSKIVAFIVSFIEMVFINLLQLVILILCKNLIVVIKKKEKKCKKVKPANSFRKILNYVFLPTLQKLYNLYRACKF